MPDWMKTPEQVSNEQKQSLISQLESQRKSAESLGVTVNNIRYSGSPENRAALLEAVQLAKQTGQSTFSSWKDSDGVFHNNHPLEEVEDALMKIATRRSALIALEGEYESQIKDGSLTSVENLDWTT